MCIVLNASVGDLDSRGRCIEAVRKIISRSCVCKASLQPEIKGQRQKKSRGENKLASFNGDGICKSIFLYFVSLNYFCI